MNLHDLIVGHPLSSLGKSAAAATEPEDGDPLLQQFNAAIAPYGPDRAKMDWPMVEQLAANLAARRCDLKVYGYLALAVFANASEEEPPYVPLAAVLHALGDVIELGWTRCLPRSDGRKQGQLKWLSEELSPLIKARPPKATQWSDVAACASLAERAAEAAGNALGLGYPILRELREAIKEHERALPPQPLTVSEAPAKVPAPVLPFMAQPTAQPPPATVATTPALATLPSTQSAVSNRPVAEAPPAPPADPLIPAPITREALEDQLSSLVVHHAAQLRGEDPTAPAPFWMLRALRWANHDLLRPDRVAEVLANKGRSQIPLPQGYRTLIKEIPQRLSTGQNTEVVAECEDLFAANPLWLDLQRFVATGLDGLGAELARAAVREQVRLLLCCCPQLAELRFADRDATPFADPETVRWLDGEKATAGKALTLPGLTNEPEQIPEGLFSGVQFLQKQIAQAPSGAGRFEIQVRLVELLLSNQRSDIAMPIVDLLVATIETHRLAEWQPELCQRTLRLAVKVARAAEIDAARRAVLFGRVCQIAPADALQLGPETFTPP